jgi:nitrous oxide reductase accessory protein NosL
MKKYSIALLFSLLSLFMFVGCEKKPVGAVQKMHWDRDMCERCKMAISERKFAVQVIDPNTGKDYKFDDIGCAVLWMEEEHIPWKERAFIWITDAKTGEWIDARKASYTDGAITPMAYGFAAYTKKTLPKKAHLFDFSAVAGKIEAIEKQNSQKVKAY